jgi:hypothetical protein
MKITQIYGVKDNQVVIQLPDSFKNQKTVKITLEEASPGKDKRDRMLASQHDPLFQADIKSVQDDFNGIEFENL